MFEEIKTLRGSDRRSVVLLFLYGFGNAASYVIARTIADSAFLSHIGPERLPHVYMISAGVVALSSLTYAQLLHRFYFRRLVVLTLITLAASSAAMPAVMQRFTDSLTVFALVYLLAQVRGSLGTIQFATLVNEQFGDRRPERVVGMVGAGATLAGITTGLAIGLIADDVNVEALMYFAAGIDLVTMLPVLALRRQKTAATGDAIGQQPPTADTSNSTSRMRDALGSPYVFSIACLVAVSVLAATLIEYQWKVTAAHSLARDEEELAQYFGYFYGTVYLLTGLLQLFVTGRVLQKRGLLMGLLAFPTALLAATCTAWLVSADRLLLWPLTLSKGCDTLKRSMNDPSVQVVYSPLESRLRQQAITFVAGIVKPFAEAVAAVALVATTPWISARSLSLVVASLILIWLALNLRVWRGFTSLRRGSGPPEGESGDGTDQPLA